MSSTLPINNNTLSLFIPTKRFNHHHEHSITSLDFDDLGQFLILSAVDRLLQLYDVHKGRYLSSIQLQKYGAHMAKFTHAGRSCLYASAPPASASISEVDNLIRLLSLDTKSYLRYFKGHKEQVLCLEVHPVHDQFISSSLDRLVKTWDVRTASATGSIDVGAASIVAYDPMGVVFAVVRFPSPSESSFGGKAVLELYDVANCDVRPFLVLKFAISSSNTYQTGSLHCTKVEFSNNGKHILVCSNSDHYVLDAFTGELVCTVPGQDYTNLKYLTSGLATFSPDGTHLLVGGSRGVRLFNLDDAIRSSESNWLQSFKTIQGDDEAKIVSFNPKLLTFATANTVVNLWQPE